MPIFKVISVGGVAVDKEEDRILRRFGVCLERIVENGMSHVDLDQSYDSIGSGYLDCSFGSTETTRSQLIGEREKLRNQMATLEKQIESTNPVFNVKVQRVRI